MAVQWETLAADLVRSARQEAGLSQRALARRASVAPTEVARIESGKVQPSLVNLGRLLDAIGVDAEVRITLHDHRLSPLRIAELIGRELEADEEDRAFRTAMVLADDLAAVTPLRLAELVEEPPASVGDSRYDALVAALVEDACTRAGITSPRWVDDPWRRTDEWLVSQIPELREVARAESSPPFLRRGILAVANEFSRA